MVERFRSALRISNLFVLPAVGWFVAFLLIPLLIIVVYSFSTKGIYGGVLYQFQIENYGRAQDWIYLQIFLNSFQLATLTTLLCLLLGYPMAYVMATSSVRVRSLLMGLIIIPFCTNLVVRTFATKVLFGEYGPLNQAALALGWIQEPIPFSTSRVLVWMGMVTNYLPFMVLPLYVSLEKFDFSLLDAAKDLGASSWKVLWKILFPLTREGIATGILFVFTPALGEFVIPDLLGGARTLMVGGLITEQFLKARDWPFGSALALMLIVVVMLCLAVYLRFSRSEEA